MELLSEQIISSFFVVVSRYMKKLEINDEYLDFFKRFGVKKKKFWAKERNGFIRYGEEEIRNKILENYLNNKPFDQCYPQISLRQLYCDKLHHEYQEGITDPFDKNFRPTKEEKEKFYRTLQNRSIDFLLVDNKSKFLVAVEVDGSYHNNEYVKYNDKILNSFFEQIGIKLFRFDLLDDDYCSSNISLLDKKFNMWLHNFYENDLITLKGDYKDWYASD